MSDPYRRPDSSSTLDYGMFSEASVMSGDYSRGDRKDVDVKQLAESFLPKLIHPARSIKSMYRKQQSSGISGKPSKMSKMPEPIEAWPEEKSKDKPLPPAVADKVKAYKPSPIAIVAAELRKSMIMLDKPSSSSSSRGSSVPQPTSVEARLPGPLKSMQRKLRKQHSDMRADENVVKLQILKNADAMIHKMPLRYLYDKPELRQYAYERAIRPIIKLAQRQAKQALFDAFAIWKVPPGVSSKLNEKQIGFMVIAKRLNNLLKVALSRKFKVWAFQCSTRFAVARVKHLEYFVIQIQQWYRHMRIVKKEPWRMLERAVEICLHRRRAIKHAMQIEAAKRQALLKIRRGVLARRRMYFAARAVERNYRWVLLCRKTRWRLTRLQAVRKIQTWRRMLLCRSENDWLLIHTVLKCGGYSKVARKIPGKIRKQRWGLLQSVNQCVVMMQKAWFTSKGDYALFLKIQARRAHQAHLKLLNDKATVIQQNARGRLWVKLLTAAFQNNRARRIQRAFRSYLYRKWVHFAALTRRHHAANCVKRIFRVKRWRRFLSDRFKLRRYMIVFMRAKKQLSCIYIQRAFRAYRERERIRKEELKKFYAQQRARAGLVIALVSKIQRNWRQMKNDGRRFPKHVRLLMRRLYLEKRRKFYLKARVIQTLAKKYLAKKAAKLLMAQTKAQKKLAFFAKSYLLKLALFDRVQATRERRARAANFIKFKLRSALWVRIVRTRFALRRARIDQEALRQWSANFIQRNMHRKFEEYYIAVRVASRRQLAKRRKKAEEDRIWKINDTAARRIQKLFWMIKKWNFSMRKVAKYRKFHVERRSAKRMQRYFRMVVAWARFWKAVDAKNKRIAAEKLAARQTGASNVIGFFWRRTRELHALKLRFVLRKQMLAVYKKLQREREEAEKEKESALEDVRRTEENMRTTIAASWKQGCDTQGRNYYYNYVTGESSWVPPENWVMKTLDVFIRTLDERLNVYYYNQQTGESRWLPPCVTCGEDSSKWCGDCGVAYCDDHFEKNHNAEADATMQEHSWSLVEYEKEKLQPGEVYCVECKRRAAKRVCTTCWDAYCDECFKFVHHIGALKFHKTVPYKKAKAGWMCVKARVASEQDYYVNGMTGETTFDKPEELMTPQELVYYQNFRSHQSQAEAHVKTIEKLQFDLEAATYERDNILYEALTGNKNIGNVLRKRQGAKMDDGAAEGALVLKETKERASKGGGIMSIFTGDKSAYHTNLLRPSDRERGKARSDYIKTLLGEDDTKKK